MISTSVQKHKIIGVLCVLCAFIPLISAAQAGSLALSVTPTLFEMSASPGQTWQSSVRVVNSNAFPITVYPDVVNFAPRGEQGKGRLLPILDEAADGSTLAEWISLDRGALVIPPETTAPVTFTVTVPDDAAPGGHFAAILIGTRPPETEGSFQLRTSQVVSSLFFVRIAGDVVENGAIRSFRTAESVVREPTAAFELRFENKGNVHLRPQGDITIYNWWGEKRGVIPINHQTNFGNVLPESIRQFNFTWTGEESITNIGRFKAVATLAYGSEARNFVTQSTYFWVIPIYELLITLGSVGLIVFVISRIIRAYVRHMLRLSGIDPDVPRVRRRVAPQDVEVVSYRQVTAPVRHGYQKLKREVSADHTSWFDRAIAVWQLIVTYRLVVASVLFVCASTYTIYWYVSEATKNDRPYTVTIENDDARIELSSEEIVYEEEFRNESPLSNTATVATTSPPSLSIVNASGKSGLGAQVQFTLETAGYEVLRNQVDLEMERNTSVIVFSLDRQDDASALSQLLGGVLLSAITGSTTDELTLYLGQDQLTSGSE